MSNDQRQPLAEKLAIVRGAGSWLGRGSAVALAWAGADVVLNNVDHEAAQETWAQIERLDGCGLIVIADVSVTGWAQPRVDAAEARRGSLDVVHANAGVERYEPPASMAEQDLDLYRVREADILQRIGMAEKIGAAIVFLASPRAAYLTRYQPRC